MAHALQSARTLQEPLRRSRAMTMGRILVVDDSLTVYVHLRATLEADGHLVDRLSTFTDLPRYLTTVRPDLILLDLEMPALSGVAFALFVRRNELQPTRIVIHSSLAEAEMRVAAGRVDALGIIPKGTPPHRLRASVKRYLEVAV
jgi:DNA-binding response OmpR family regulator